MLFFALKLLLLQSAIVSGANILGLLNAPYLSHYKFAKGLLDELVKKGHQVTVLSPFAKQEPVSKATNILLEEAPVRYPDVFQWKSMLTPYRVVIEGKDYLLELCDMELGTKGVQTLLQFQSTFDVVFMETSGGECFLGLVHYFGSPPVVVLSPFGISPVTAWELGAPNFPSCMVNNMLRYEPHNLGIWEKLDNFVFQCFYMHNYHKLLNKHDKIARKYFGNDMPFLGEVARNILLALVNIAPGIDDPRPLPPSVIPVGGMHIPRETKPLPQDLKTYVDEAKDGFLLFSLGSNVRAANIPAEKLNIFLEVFRLLAPIKVLWKWEEEHLPGQSKNIRISKWLPQNDLLAHPNVRAFVSHCGKLSTLEAIHHGVPVVALPFVWDQNGNSNNLQRLGAAICLDYHTMTTKDLLQAVQQVIYNASYKNNAQELSAVLRDQPQHPLDRAVFWTEYVLRHGHKVANTLKPLSVNLSWYEYLLLDVLVTILAVFVMVFLILRCLWKVLTRSSRKKTKTR